MQNNAKMGDFLLIFRGEPGVCFTKVDLNRTKGGLNTGNSVI